VDHFIFRWEQSLKLCSDWVSKFKVLSNVSDLLFHLTGKNAEKIIIFTDFIKTVIISSTCRPLFVCFQSVAVIDYTANYYSYNVIHDIFVFFTFYNPHTWVDFDTVCEISVYGEKCNCCASWGKGEQITWFDGCMQDKQLTIQLTTF